MMYEGPGLLTVVWFGSSPSPFPLEARPVTHRKTEKEKQMLTGGGEGVGEEPNQTTARKTGPL